MMWWIGLKNLINLITFEEHYLFLKNIKTSKHIYEVVLNTKHKADIRIAEYTTHEAVSLILNKNQPIANDSCLATFRKYS